MTVLFVVFLSAADVAFDALCMYLYACVCARACGVTHKIMCVHEIQVFAENMVTKCYIVMFASMFFVSSSFYHLIGFSFFWSNCVVLSWRKDAMTSQSFAKVERILLDCG